MPSLGLQILGVGLAVLGWIGNILICMLPLWKVSAFIGNNIVVAQTIWEGLWMSCVVQSTGQMQCKVYDSLLALPPDLQAARAMIVISILFSLFGLLLSVVGGKCTTCVCRVCHQLLGDSCCREDHLPSAAPQQSTSLCKVKIQAPFFEPQPIGGYKSR
uniref:Claudin n=1 Tax=Pundamilia nyererei TaxID=303518 RepID=A0A3B4GPK9_9CICH